METESLIDEFTKRLRMDSDSKKLRIFFNPSRHMLRNRAIIRQHQEAVAQMIKPGDKPKELLGKALPPLRPIDE